MEDYLLLDHCITYMRKLCEDIAERCVGTEGNRQATAFFEEILASFGWATSAQEFDATDWFDGGATLMADDKEFEVFVSPYSLGYSGQAMLSAASNIAELQKGNFDGTILLLHGNMAHEQLMPKNFPFYNPEEHQQIVGLLENSKAHAILCATGRNPSLAGGVYPFPLIEDGDFDIPSVYMTAEEGKQLLPFIGKKLTLHSVSKRISGKGCNVIGRKGDSNLDRVVITAHIDAKKGTPGAIDNATGVTVLLLLAELLTGYSGKKRIEIVALNGEDYYSAPGQIKYIIANQYSFGDILLNINIDGAAYRNSKSAFSFFDLPEAIKQKASKIVEQHPDIVEGEPWPQGDHSIFVQKGRPAIAITSEWFLTNLDSQEITHTSKDNLRIVDYKSIVTVTKAIKELVELL